MRIYRAGMVFGLPRLEHVCEPILDGLPTGNESVWVHLNRVLCVQRTNSSRVMIVVSLVPLLTNCIIQLLDLAQVSQFLTKTRK